MNEKGISTHKFVSESNAPAFHFVKNKKDEREMQPVAREDIRTLVQEKVIGVICPGHIHIEAGRMHIASTLLDALSTRSANLDKILVIERQDLLEIGIMENNIPRQEVFEFKNFSRTEDLAEIFLKAEKKPYKEKNANNFYKHYNPQKLKNGFGYAKKHRQRKR